MINACLTERSCVKNCGRDFPESKLHNGNSPTACSAASCRFQPDALVIPFSRKIEVCHDSAMLCPGLLELVLLEPSPKIGPAAIHFEGVLQSRSGNLQLLDAPKISPDASESLVLNLYPNTKIFSAWGELALWHQFSWPAARAAHWRYAPPPLPRPSPS